MVWHWLATKFACRIAQNGIKFNLCVAEGFLFRFFPHIFYPSFLFQIVGLGIS